MVTSTKSHMRKVLEDAFKFGFLPSLPIGVLFLFLLDEYLFLADWSGFFTSLFKSNKNDLLGIQRLTKTSGMYQAHGIQNKYLLYN